MDSYRYYQFINTVDVVEFAPTAYHFYGVFNRTMVYGVYVEDYGLLSLSDHLTELDEETKNDIKKIIETKIEELKEEEKEKI